MTTPVIWKWSHKKYLLAKHIADGDTNKEAGRKVGLARETVQGYMNRVPEFRAYVDKITLENELVSRSGTIRALVRKVREKEEVTASDKSTHLEYLKFLRDVVKENDNDVTKLEVTFK